MSNLESLKKQIMEEISKIDDFFLFNGLPDPEEFNSKTIHWEKDYKGFLDSAKHVKAKLIYFQEQICDNEESPHYNQLETFAFSYIFNGLNHIFIASADWVSEKVTKELMEEINKPGFFDQQEEEIEKELNKHIHSLYSTKRERHKYFNIANKDFWENNDAGNDFSLNPKQVAKKSKVTQNVRDNIRKELEQEERSMLPELVEKCVIWCKENGLSALTLLNVKEFCRNQGIELLPMVRDNLLRDKVNSKLKQDS